MRKLDILNRGFSGYNTDHCRLILPKVLEVEHKVASKVKLMTIFLGTNDALSTIQHVPVSRYRENLASMVDEALRYDIKLVVIGPALHDPKLLPPGFAENGPGDISSSSNNKTYSEAARSVAEQYKVPFLDLWTAFQNKGGWSDEQLAQQSVSIRSLLSDGIHFTPEAYQVLYEELISIIDHEYPELAPGNLKMKLAIWNTIDPYNIEKTMFTN